jgi:prevent-host-death family protein
MSHETAAHPVHRGADTAAMKTVTITEAEAGIARLIRLVRKGETIVITSRGKAVAEIGPFAPRRNTEIPPVPPGDWTERQIDLHRRGIIRLPTGKLDLAELRKARERNAPFTGSLQALLDEREEGR